MGALLGGDDDAVGQLLDGINIVLDGIEDVLGNIPFMAGNADDGGQFRNAGTQSFFIVMIDYLFSV
jgi:hypothetical protein